MIDEQNIYLIFECLPMSLKRLLNYYMFKDQLLDESLIQSYLYQISIAVSFCHERRVFHRDLCPENLLIDKNGLIKVSFYDNFSKMSI